MWYDGSPSRIHRGDPGGGVATRARFTAFLVSLKFHTRDAAKVWTYVSEGEG
jgi:hypothetical protein